MPVLKHIIMEETKCPTKIQFEREQVIKELLKDLESELPQPRFEEVKSELLSLLDNYK